MRASAARAIALGVCLAALLAFPATSASAAPPAATTDAASAVGERLATMHGRVDPGGSPVSGCVFEFGTTTAYGALAPCVPGPAAIGAGGEIAVSATTPALEPGVTYHYRLRATGPISETDVGLGADRTFTTAGTPPCENAPRRLEQGIATILLPDCMALELVSPAQKFNQFARLGGAGIVSADGERVVFRSIAALGETPNLADPFLGDPYLAGRGEAGWATQPTTPPAGMRSPGNAQSFSPDLTGWIHVPVNLDDVEFNLRISQAFRGGLGGLFERLSPPLAPLGDPASVQILSFTLLQGASEDHSRVYFSPGPAGTVRTTSYISGDPVPAGTGEDTNVYLARLDANGQPSARLLARDTTGADAGKAWGGNCGARLGGIGRTTGTGNTAPNGRRNQGAISLDGTRAYFSARASQPQSGNCSETNKMRILERIEDAAGEAEITELIEGECDRVADPGPPAVPACATHDGDDLYQGASLDQSRVYFTTNRQLADSDTDGNAAQCSISSAVEGCDLYLYDRSEPAGQRLTQVSRGEPGSPTPGAGARVFNGVAAISADGTRAYFAAEGVLTTAPNPLGRQPEAGKPNLYAWDADAGRLAFVGTLATGDANGLWRSPEGTWGNDAYPVPILGPGPGGGDGRVLLLRSRAALSGDDQDGGARDVYRYDAAADPPTLVRVSKAAPGGAEGSFDVSTSSSSGGLGTDYAERGRWAGEDGKTVVFETAEGLIPGDRNGAEDAYLWREGTLSLLPGEASDPALSHDGETVAFAAIPQLLPADGDTIDDVYAARVGGGFEHLVPSSCAPDGGEACQGAAANPPPLEGSDSVDAVGPGNVKPAPVGGVNRCAKLSRSAKASLRNAKRLRRAAKRASALRARRLNSRAHATARKARRAAGAAKRCRRPNLNGRTPR